MKSLLVLIVAAVVFVGCGNSEQDLPALILAAKEGNIEAVKQHIAAGTDVNAKGEYGLTPLHYAAGEGHKEIIELLIANGADVDVKTPGQNTALDLAVTRAIFSKHTEIVDLIRKHSGKTGEELKAEGK